MPSSTKPRFSCHSNSSWRLMWYPGQQGKILWFHRYQSWGSELATEMWLHFFVHFPGTAWVIGGMLFSHDTETWWSVINATLYLAVFRLGIHWDHWGKMNSKRAVSLQSKGMRTNGGQFLCASSVTTNWLVIAFQLPAEALSERLMCWDVNHQESTHN